MGEKGKRLRKVWFFQEDQYAQAEEWLNDLAEQGWQLDHVGQWIAVFKSSGGAVMQYACVPDTSYHTFVVDDSAKDAFEKAGWRYVDSQRGAFIFSAPAGTARPELPAEHAVPKPGLAKVQHWIGNILQFAVVAFLVLLCIGEIVTGSLADMLLHRELDLFILLLFFILGIADYARERQLTRQKQRAAVETAENNAMGVLAFRKTYVRNMTVRMLCIGVPLLFIFIDNIFPYTTTTQPLASEHMVQISVSDIMKTTSDTSTFDYTVSRSFLYPQQMEMREYTQDASGSVLQLEEYRAQTPWLADVLADELARFGPANGREHNQLQPSGDKMGFERLWYFAADSEAILLAQKGDDVYLIKIEEPAPLGDMAGALKAKIALAGGGK